MVVGRNPSDEPNTAIHGSTAESFRAYTPDGSVREITVRNRWDAPSPGLRREREAFCVRNKLIVPTNSCAASCIMAEATKGQFDAA